MESLKQVGRVGFKTLLYFEVVTTIALVIGLVVANVLRPGAGLDIDPATLDTHAVSHYVADAHVGAVELLDMIVPNSVVGAFARGDLLQVLLFSVLFGVALAIGRSAAACWCACIDQFGDALLRIVEMICGSRRSAHSARWRSRSATTARHARSTLGQLILCFYVTSILFIVVVLGAAARWAGVGLWPLLRLLPRGTPDRAGHVLHGVGAAALWRSSNAWAARARSSGSCCRRLSVQPRRRGHLLTMTRSSSRRPPTRI